MDEKRLQEMLELMQIPEVEQMIFAQFEQAKLVFRKRIKEYLSAKEAGAVDESQTAASASTLRFRFSLRRNGKYLQIELRTPDGLRVHPDPYLAQEAADWILENAEMGCFKEARELGLGNRVYNIRLTRLPDGGAMGEIEIIPTSADADVLQQPLALFDASGYDQFPHDARETIFERCFHSDQAVRQAVRQAVLDHFFYRIFPTLQEETETVN